MLSKCLYADQYSNVRLRFPGVEKSVYLTKIIGSGGFSDIYATTDGEYVVKVQKLPGDAEREEFEHTIELHKRCISDNVVRIYGLTYVRQTAFLLMERGEQLTMLDRGDPALLIALARALCCVHAQRISHRDVKLENMLKCRGGYKLTDFGSATANTVDFAYLLNSEVRQAVYSDIYAHTTQQFRAPEQIELLHDCGPICHAVDVFAFGVCIFLTATDNYPFDSPFASFQCRPNFSAIYNEKLRALAQQCLVRNVRERVGMQEVLKALEQAE